jgi:peptide/nickel transport system permease protein
MIPVILLVSVMIFTIMYFTPGDPAVIILGSNVSMDQLEQKREELGLNESYLVRLTNYLSDVYLRFDFGRSYINNRSISAQIGERFTRTLLIASLSVLLSIAVGVPLGIIAAVNQYSWKDNFSMFMSLVASSMPGFWIALMMSLIFAQRLGWLPSTGIASWKSYIMPVIATAIGGIAAMARQTRSSMLEVIRSDFITTARAKGQTERKVIYGHALRNALIPIVTSAGGAFGFQLGGALIAETVFSVPGLGLFMMNAISQRDYPAIQGAVIFLAVLFGLVMLLVDILYAVIDPRIKSQYQGRGRKTNA